MSRSGVPREERLGEPRGLSLGTGSLLSPSSGNPQPRPAAGGTGRLGTLPHLICDSCEVSPRAGPPILLAFGQPCLSRSSVPSPAQGRCWVRGSQCCKAREKHRSEHLLCQKLRIHGKSLLGSPLNQLNSLYLWN